MTKNELKDRKKSTVALFVSQRGLSGLSPLCQNGAKNSTFYNWIILFITASGIMSRPNRSSTSAVPTRSYDLVWRFESKQLSLYQTNNFFVLYKLV